MNVTYTDKVKKAGEQYVLLQRVSKKLVQVHIDQQLLEIARN